MAGAAIFALRFSGFLVQCFAGANGEMWLLYAPPLAAIGAAGFLLFAPPSSRKSLLRGAA
jgi:hypothetical protein